jgi:hypothetical protein
MNGGWIAVDLDGTLAEYNGWTGGGVGNPVPRMAARVRAWLATGRDVRIFTARVARTGLRNQVGGVDDDAFADEQTRIIQDWTEIHFGVRLPCTASKDFGMVELWDDRAIQVVPNCGTRVDGNP